MKKSVRDTLIFLAAVFLAAIFWATMLSINPSCGFLELIISSLVFAISISFSIKKKSSPLAIASLIFSAILFYLVWGIHGLILLSKGFKDPIITYASITFIITFVVIIVYSIIRKIWNSLSRRKVILSPEDVHVVTLIGTPPMVYSGTALPKTDISTSKGKKYPVKESEYGGNHYFDFRDIKWLRMFIGMKIQKIRMDDKSIKIKNIENIKSKEKIEFTFGSAAFHFCAVDFLLVARKWPGKDMDIEVFKEKILDIIEEAVEVTTSFFTIKELTGGNIEVNDKFKEVLAEKLEAEYGISITNAKLSKESGNAINQVKLIKTEALRGQAEVATEKADQKVKDAKNNTMLKENILKVTRATGEKNISIVLAEGKAKEVEIAALAEAMEIMLKGGADADALTKLVKAQASDDVFLKNKTLETQEAIAKSLKDIYPNLSTIIGGGERAGLAEIMAMVKTTLGIDLGKISEKADKKADTA